MLPYLWQKLQDDVSRRHRDVEHGNWLAIVVTAQP